MWIGIAVVLVVVVVVGGIGVMATRGRGATLTEKDLAFLQKRSAAEIVDVLKCRDTIIAMSASEDAPLRKLVDQAVVTVGEQVVRRDELRARMARTERRVGILKNSTDQTAQVAGQTGLAASDVSAHQLQAEFQREVEAEKIAAESLKQLHDAVASLQTAASAMPKEGKPSSEQVSTLQESADALANLLPLKR